MAGVQSGLERVLSGDVKLPAGARTALLANPTAVDRSFRHAADLLAGVSGLKLTALFGPEHGLRGDAQDMISVDEARDSRTNLPVYSLYGKDETSLSPTDESLRDVDVILYDIQDVGSRYYTYVWTLVLAMRAAAKNAVKVIVLDRPNPIGGHLVEGGAIEDRYRSFVGHMSVPNRHGMTAGEIATFAKATDKLDVELEVITCKGWRRNQWYDETGLPWVLPSPNMPTLDTALVYPGMCLVEGTELSEGRGTTRPFEISGGAYIDADLLADTLNGANLPGVRFRPLYFTPTFHKFGKEQCGGVQFHVTDRETFLPYQSGVAFLWAIKKLYPSQFAWRHRAYEFRDDVPAIDLLTGSPAVRTAIDAGAPLQDVVETWRADEKAFIARRKAWLLYP